ncbi:MULTISPECIES: ROK family protein [Pseudomonadati]|uniref:ROK family protein n=1 Tax=Shewanella aestuarii TaxID=1028752 RepID=A0ABT0KYN5_9GAMM|nr:ROK family protein [Shewanella aestuarii]MCL1116287.1 ROK family protein [Shewanella aestuarii]GGN71391.1 N-acetylmannosamine kinase [Shewanella aestuarii]
MIIAIDIGGTKISAALMNDNKIIESRKTDSIIHHDLNNLANYVIQLCQGWIDKAHLVAVACTGQVGTNHVHFLSAKQTLPLKQQLKTGFNLPVVMLNDAAAAAWAEYCLGPKRQDNTLVYITVSTGIGGGIIQNGQLITANDGFCAHIGHMSVSRPSLPQIQCHCGRINCVEAISSGTAIAKQASQILNYQVNCKTVFEQHLSHPEIATLLEQSTDALVDLIANIKALTGTAVVVLGGSVGSASPFREKVIEKITKLPQIYQVNLVSPITGEHADLIGAALFAQTINGFT